MTSFQKLKNCTDHMNRKIKRGRKKSWKQIKEK